MIRRGPILAVLCTSLLIVSLDNTILNVALPVLVRHLHASSSELQWIVDAYAVVFAGLMLVAGSLGDRLGRKPVFVTGLVAFAAGSAWSAFSSTPDMLVAARAFMGLGASAIMPSTLSILTNVFTSDRDRARAIGIWSGTTGLGVAIGPVAGGWLLDHFWWGSVFLVNVPIALVGAVLALWLVPNSHDPAARSPDVLGALLSIAGLGLLLWGIIDAPTRSWTSVPVLAATTGGCAVLALFGWWEHRSRHPMLDLAFFRAPRFSAAMGTLGLTMFALMGGLFILTQYLQFSLGYSPLAAGLRLAPMAAVLLVVAPVSNLIASRIGTKPVVLCGLALIVVGLLALSRTTVHGTYRDVLPPLVMMGIGIGLAFAPCTESVMGALPRARAGVGSATNGAALQTGGALGVGIMGSILNNRYRDVLAPHLAGYHVPGQVLGTINGSLGGALTVAADVGGAVGAALAADARTAFVSGTTAAAVVAAAVVAGAALIVLVALPNRSRRPGEDGSGVSRPAPHRPGTQLRFRPVRNSRRGSWPDTAGDSPRHSRNRPRAAGRPRW